MIAGLLLLVTLILAVCGVILVRQGFRPRRRGETPHCRKCDYNLTGLTSERCPECGARLSPLATEYGERRRSARRIVGGLLCLVPAALALLFVLGTLDWYQFCPTALVISELQSANTIRAQQAWNELDRRYVAGDLSASHNSRLIDYCLQEQAKPANGPLTSGLVNHLGRLYLAGQMSVAQQDRFIKQALLLTLRVRPNTVLGQPAPFQVNYTARIPSTPFWVRVENADFFVDGRKTRDQGSMGTMSGCGAGGGCSNHVPIDTIGRHKVGVVAHARIWTGPFGDEASSQPVGKLDASAEAATDVLAVEPPDYIKHTCGPALDTAVRNSFEPKDLKLSTAAQFEMTLAIRSPLVGIAMDVFIRTEGREYKVTAVHVASGESTNWSLGIMLRDADGGMPAAFTSCDVILRSSDAAARDSVNLFEIWEGELVYKDVPVAVEAPATQPTLSAGP